MNKTKKIEDFFPDKDKKWFIEYGCDKVADILSSNDEDGVKLLLGILEQNKLKCYYILKDNFLSSTRTDEIYNVSMHHLHMSYYNITHSQCRIEYGNPPRHCYSPLALPNCFIDYIRNLEN